MNYRAILFDLDGTLLDTLEDLADSMNSVLRRSGFPEHELYAYKYFVGDGMLNLVRRAVPENARTDESLVAACLASMKEEYGRRWKEKTRPYPGVPEMLDALGQKGVKMVVLSNKPHEFTQLTVTTLLPRWKFDAVFGERPSVPRKPDPAGALEIAAAIDVRPAEFLYLGDTSTDMITANAAGMYPVGALWGFRTAEELTASGAKTLIREPSGLLHLL